jgi:hypothetical protein
MKNIPCVRLQKNIFLWRFTLWLFRYGEELLAPSPTLKLEEHPAVRDCLFNTRGADKSLARTTSRLKDIWRKNTAEGHQGGLVLARQCPGSPGTSNPEENGLLGVPMSCLLPGQAKDWSALLYIHSYPPSWRPFFHPQTEDAWCRDDRDPGVYRVLVGKPEGKISLGRPRRRWEDNIKMDLQEVGWLRIGTGGGHLWMR